MDLSVPLSITIRKKKKSLFVSSICLFIQILGFSCAFAQEKPPRPIIVTVVVGEGLIFGSMFQTSSSGTVILSANGSRTFTGGVLQGPSSYPYAPAIFHFDANKGALITIMNGPDITLAGSNGGSISLQIGSSDLGSPFVCTSTSPATTQLRVGGTLTLGSNAANPPGNYSGTFTMTFVQN